MKIHLNTKVAMTVHRRILARKRLVYLLAAPKPQKYRDGKSRIVYIGTTGKGVDRIAKSVAYRAQNVLQRRGLRKLDVHIVSCSARPGMRSWQHLEDALLAAFRGLYHELPDQNRQGKRLRWGEKFDRFFKRSAIERILRHFESGRA